MKRGRERSLLKFPRVCHSKANCYSYDIEVDASDLHNNGLQVVRLFT